jgi:hypothetical protein
LQSGGTCGGNYGLYVAPVGTAGLSTNDEIYAGTSGSPFIVDSAGNVTGPGVLNLGTSGSVAAAIVFSNATSGTDTLSPQTGALGTLAHTLPATSGTLALSNNAADVSTTATGTAYTMTASAATVVFGTTSPVVTLTAAGAYNLTVTIKTALVGATYAALQTAGYGLYRTNNTPGALSTTFQCILPICTTTSLGAGTVTIADIPYTTANTNDTISIQGILTATPSAGSVTCSGVTITATWLHP